MVLDRASVELNEVRWWSKWARLRWRGDGYLLTSEGLTEPFFNRAGGLTCEAVTQVFHWAELELSRSGMNSTVMVFESCRAVSSLYASGYVKVDRMSILESKGPITGGKGAGSIVISDDPKTWADAYLDSFYDGRALEGVVVPIAMRLLNTRGVTLFESRDNGKTAGVMALFKTPGILGLYCLGTLPEHRGRGIATGLIARAKHIAHKEHRRLVLQTLMSDGATGLYRRRGFAEIYSKLILERSLNAHPGSRP